MFSWVELALALIKIANALIGWARARELISQGQDQEIARQSAAILVESKFAKDTMTALSGMTEAQTDDVLKQLGGA